MSSLVDPATLSPAERIAFEAIDAHLYRRDRNGYRRPGTARTVTLKMVRRLEAKGLVRERIERGMPVLSLTGSGRNTLSIIHQRRETKNARRQPETA